MSPRLRSPRRDLLALVLLVWGPWPGARAAPIQQGPADGTVPPEAIEAAVRRATEHLLAQQQRDGSWAYESQRYPTGQTALSAYTLLKAGLPLDHPALQRALVYLQQDLPEETYSMGCQLQLYEATRDPAWRERMVLIVERLRAIDLGGEWGYPLTHADPDWIPREGRPDLSNTQYAVLGLRAAHHSGVEVPRKLWSDIVERTLAFQEPPRAADPEEILGRRVAGRFTVAGFRYVSDGSRGPSGSMTAAGLTVLGIARDVLGPKLGPRRERDIEQALEMGMGWLAANWSVDANPGEGGWHKYYLYGLERAGGVLGIESIGGHTWFAEGSRLLVTSQRDNGSWDDSLPDTCFAILFLRRATAAAASNVSAALAPAAFASDQGDLLVLRGLGQPTISLWLDPPSGALREAHSAGLYVDGVEYLVDGETVAAVMGDPSSAWETGRFPARHRFTTRGRHQVSARVHLARPGGAAPGDPHPAPLSTRGFEVDVRYALEEWMLDFAAARSRDLLRGVRVTVTASSQVAAHEGPEKACDGRQGTRWLAGHEDRQPWLRLELSRAVKADRIVLSQATPRELYRDFLSRVDEAEILLNRDEQPLRVVFEPDEMRPTTIELGEPRSITQLELRVTTRRRGNAWPDLIGIAEVALELGR